MTKRTKIIAYYQMKLKDLEDTLKRKTIRDVEVSQLEQRKRRLLNIIEYMKKPRETKETKPREPLDKQTMLQQVIIVKEHELQQLEQIIAHNPPINQFDRLKRRKIELQQMLTVQKHRLAELEHAN